MTEKNWEKELRLLMTDPDAEDKDRAILLVYSLLSRQKEEIASMPAFAAMQKYTQVDEDGVMVLVSRQAIEEIVAALKNQKES